MGKSKKSKYESTDLSISTYGDIIDTLPDGRVICNGLHGLTVIDIDSGKTIEKLGKYNDITALTIRDDLIVVYATKNGSLNLLNLISQKSIELRKDSHEVWDSERATRVLEGGIKAINALVTLPSGDIVRAEGATLSHWNIKTGIATKIKVGGKLDNDIEALTVRPDGSVVSASTDWSSYRKETEILTVWDVTKGCITSLQKEHSRSSYSKVKVLTALPDGCIVSGSSKGELGLWDFNKRKYTKLKKYQDEIADLTALPDGRVICATVGNDLDIWNIQKDYHTRLTGYFSDNHFRALTTLHDGRVVSISREGTLLWSGQHFEFQTEHARSLGIEASSIAELRQTKVEQGKAFLIDTLVHMSEQGELATIEYCLAKNIPFDEPNSAGELALTAATTHGQVQVMDVLIKAGATPAQKNGAGESAFDIAINKARDNHQLETLACLAQHNVEGAPQALSAIQDQQENAKQEKARQSALAQQKLDLFKASEDGKTEIVRILLSEKVPPRLIE